MTDVQMSDPVGRLSPALVQAANAVVKRLGEWTVAEAIEVRVRRGRATLDLRSSTAASVCLDVEDGVLSLLVDDATILDCGELRTAGRCRIRDRQATGGDSGRTVALAGELRHGQLRVFRGGLATWVAMFDRGQLRRMHAEHRAGR